MKWLQKVSVIGCLGLAIPFPTLQLLQSSHCVRSLFVVTLKMGSNKNLIENYTYSSVHINESKVLHKTEVT